MALNNNGLNVMANALASSFPYLSLHSANPGTTGTAETSAARVAANWSAASDGDITATDRNFTGGTASSAVAYVGIWSAASGGTFGGGFATSGDATFSGSGEYSLSTFTINGASS